jgi:hypothetical protein
VFLTQAQICAAEQPGASYTSQPFWNDRISMMVTSNPLRFPAMGSICSFEHEQAK